MGLNVKLGKGGHGLEVYDEEGKYASDFSFQVNGQQIKGYDEFRSLCFANLAQDSAGQYDVAFLENLYNTNQSFKDNMDGQLYQEYNRLLTEAVNEYNQRTQTWNTPEEAAEHVHELFVPSLVQNLIDNGILKSDKSNVTSNYRVNTLAACFQMSRYPKRKANSITEEEYEDRANQGLLQKGNLSLGSSTFEIENYINDALANERYIPVTRNVGTFSKEEREQVLSSFYDENSPRHSCLSYDGDGYLGSAVYCSTGGYDGYIRWSSGTILEGMVKLKKNLRLLECPVTQSFGSPTRCNRSIPELNKFRSAIDKDYSKFEQNIKDKIMAAGVKDPADAQVIARKFYNRLKDDPGFCAIVLGYDAIWGLSFQFDILNLGVLDVVKKE